MLYHTTRTDTHFFAYLDGQQVGKFEAETFLTSVVISK